MEILYILIFLLLIVGITILITQDFLRIELTQIKKDIKTLEIYKEIKKYNKS